MADVDPAADGLVRCADCRRCGPVQRKHVVGDYERRYTTRGCHADPLRPALVLDKWRRCEVYQARLKRPEARDGV